MSFNSKDFSVMAYANGFTLWSYQTADAMATVKAEGYFNTTSPFARKGDMVLVTADNAGIVSADIISIKDVAEDVVTASSILGVAA